MGQPGTSIVMHFETEEESKRYFAIVLCAKEGHIGEACKALGISRRKYQRWIDEDQEFAADCQGAMEGLIDLAQSKLVENIRDNSSKDIQFLLKTQGRHRGYGEKVEHEHSGMIGHAHAIGYYPPEPKTLAEWEQQVTEARRLRAERESALTDTSDNDQDELSNDSATDSPNDTGSVPQSLALVPAQATG